MTGGCLASSGFAFSPRSEALSLDTDPRPRAAVQQCSPIKYRAAKPMLQRCKLGFLSPQLRGGSPNDPRRRCCHGARSTKITPASTGSGTQLRRGRAYRIAPTCSELHVHTVRNRPAVQTVSASATMSDAIDSPRPRVSARPRASAFSDIFAAAAVICLFLRPARARFFGSKLGARLSVMHERRGDDTVGFSHLLIAHRSGPQEAIPQHSWSATTLCIIGRRPPRFEQHTRSPSPQPTTPTLRPRRTFRVDDPLALRPRERPLPCIKGLRIPCSRMLRGSALSTSPSPRIQTSATIASTSKDQPQPFTRIRKRRYCQEGICATLSFFGTVLSCPATFLSLR